MVKKLLLAVFACACVADALACTNFIVGKKASVDGSVMCTYNADDYGMFQGLCHYPAGTHAKGEKLKIYDWDTKVYHGEIDQAPVTYNVIGNINEFQVTIAETTYGGREEMVDTTGVLDYGSLIYIALQRSKTAREAIKVMTSLVEKYGYCSEGETFTVCDPDEAWIMEMMGAGPGSKSVVWVALRVPDDAICAHANQSRIGKFNMKDKKNVLYSKNVVKYARQMGWFKGKDEDFSWKNAYAFPDFSGRRFCEARVWSFFRHFDNSFDRYLPWAEGKDPNAEDMPLWIVPNRKLSVKDVENCMRDHYEGTALDIANRKVAGGIWNMPYQPTPLTYKVDGKTCFNERPISTQQTGFTFVAQMRSWLPREIGGVLWFGNDDPNMCPYTPIYCSATQAPACYTAVDNADAVTFSWQSAFWVQNWVANMTYPRYSQLFPTLQTERDSIELGYIARQQAVEQQAADILASEKGVAGVRDFLTAYSSQSAQTMLKRWRALGEHLIVKFNDMVIKPQELDGSFSRTPDGLGARPVRPGYPESYRRAIVKETGDKFLLPE
ncbi:MAG: C69 family dipeptidase [Prevotella sp.]|nr:C69 family dipeptidase [Prevotella sp.]